MIIKNYLLEELEYNYDALQINDDEMTLHVLNLPPVDRDLHSLLHHSKLWKLGDTNIISMCDFDDDEGILKFLNNINQILNHHLFNFIYLF